MIQASRLKMCEGEYAFFALDLYMDDIIGIGKNGWNNVRNFVSVFNHTLAIRGETISCIIGIQMMSSMTTPGTRTCPCSS